MMTADVTYYAHWTVKSYAVTFDANGGDGDMTVTRTHGSTLGSLPIPTLEGYTFDGWFTAANGGIQVTTTTAVTADVTYYAHWTIKNYTVTFDANGGSGGTMVTRTHGTLLGTLPTPTREGYTFDGWFTAANGGTQVSDTMVVTADVTYYAHWTIKNYTVTFDANGGSGGTTVTRPYGSTLGSLPMPTLEGYTFDGWFTGANGGTYVSNTTTVTFDVTYYAHWSVISNGIYCVINLAAGSDASSYPVIYMNEPPEGGFNTDEYKTTKLVLRRIEPGTIPTRDTAITKSFYIGLFEVTQRQYELVTGDKPSYFNNTDYYATRPVEQVSYGMIRGLWNGVRWPGSSAVDAYSFMGKLRVKTGIDTFDLPTEAQWEYACRAGTTTDYNNGKNNTGSACDNMAEVGRYWYNGGQNYNQSCGTSAGTAKVGSFLPNAWGLYDMHGNVSEWCLDWYDSLSSGVTDPAGPSSGSHRVLRGGSWYDFAYFCASSARRNSNPSDESYIFGFRLVRTLSN